MTDLKIANEAARLERQWTSSPRWAAIERPYSLDEIRYNVALRDRMRRIDVDTINFDFGSWEVGPDEVRVMAAGIKRHTSRASAFRGMRWCLLVPRTTGAASSPRAPATRARGVDRQSQSEISLTPPL